MPTAMPTPSPAPVPTATIVPTPRPSPTPTATPSPTPAPTATATPTPEPTPALGPEIQAVASIGACELYLEVADDPEERAVGLMGRESLGRDRGMLFVYAAEQVLSFWMKGTLIPLDIVFINGDSVVVDVQTMRPEHETAPNLPITRSAAPARYAIEVNEGVAAECGIEPGVVAEIRTLS